ncbi:vanin-like protein 2 isoform X1 [Bombyx mori]|uniref:CN hydrolase domain-containing protein n=1 Tax=Bombyx mori TaxID=7091 RepID=A0A8R2APL8_BOMMO|nr:vanin-like protein 2 isoform X1 [Bombyx mori]
MKGFIFCLLFVSLTKTSFQKSTPQDSQYVAAAVEYIVSGDVDQNIRNYVRYIEEAAKQNADIIVFPELTLTNRSTSFVAPLHGILKQYPIPALHPNLYDNIMVSISAAARTNQIYVVVNGRELMDCTKNDTGEPCPELKEYIFNTNVVFDRNGAVIDRYRKINLFGESSHTPALTPDLGYFETDFGVKFSHFICFDLMFQVPAVQSVQKLKVTDVLFTTMWFSELPYLTAVQIQEAYAYEMNINFIAAGANNVRIGSAGSGIYSGRAGALVSIMPGVPTTRLLVSRVPKIPGQISGQYPGPIYDNPSDHDNLKLITDPSLVSHVSKLLVPGFQEFTLTDKDVSCTFRVRLNYGTGETFPHFRAVVQDGANIYAHREIGVAACSVVACSNNEFKSCGRRYKHEKANVEIEDLAIKMTTYSNTHNTTLQCDNVVYYPVSFGEKKFPLDTKNYTFTKEKSQDKDYKTGNRWHLLFQLNKPQKDLMAFGIWGRLYLRDVTHKQHVTNEDIDDFENILDLIYGKRNEISNEVNAIGNDNDKYEIEES